MCTSRHKKKAQRKGKTTDPSKKDNLTMLTSLRAPPPRHSGVRLTNQDKIAFLHPGYSAPRNQLFSLPRVDAVDDDAGRKCGVHHLTALTACQVVANNAFGQGRLCTDAEGLRFAAEPMDGVLTASHYYFVIDGNGTTVPVLDSKPPVICLPCPKISIPSFPVSKTGNSLTPTSQPHGQPPPRSSTRAPSPRPGRPQRHVTAS